MNAPNNLRRRVGGSQIINKIRGRGYAKKIAEHLVKMHVPTHPLDMAADAFGSQSSLAAELGVSPAVVSQWKSGFRRIPLKYCTVIERLTEGKVRCETLRPDFDWAQVRAGAPLSSEDSQ